MNRRTVGLLAAAAALALLPATANAAASSQSLPEGALPNPHLAPSALEAQGWIRGGLSQEAGPEDGVRGTDQFDEQESEPSGQSTPSPGTESASPSAAATPTAGATPTEQHATAQPDGDASATPSQVPQDQDSASPSAAESATAEATPSASPSSSTSPSPSVSASEQVTPAVRFPVMPNLLDEGAWKDSNTSRPIGMIFIRSYGDYGSLCTGALIGKAGSTKSKWVLTARHCFVASSDESKYNPKLNVSPSRVTFHPSPDASGPSYGASRIILDPRNDLALVELKAEVSKRPYQVASVEPGRGTSFTSYGYGPDASKPGGTRRNYAGVNVNGYVSTPSQFCGDQYMVGTSSSVNIQGDSGGPAVAGNNIVGVMSAGSLTGFKGPRGEKLVAKPGEAGLSYWVSADAIRQFLYEQPATRAFQFGPGKTSVNCVGQHKAVSATIISTSDSDTRWAAAVSNGSIYYYHPAGARERLKAVNKPVVMNIRVCYMNAAGCVTEQDALVPAGWRQVDAADGSDNPFYAQSGIQWIRSYYKTQWGSNDTYVKFRGRPANQNAPVGITRMGGASRVDTAAQVYRQGGFKGSSRYAVLVSGNNFADAVVSAPLAAQYGTGVLLTSSAGKLEPAVRSALSYGNVNHVFIVGSTGSVSAAKESELRAAGMKVTRLGGTDRFATSVAVGSHLKGKGASRVALLADYQSFPDALSAGAAAGQNKGFVLLTRASWVNGQWRDTTPEAVRKLAMGQSERYAVGGKAYTATRRWNNTRIVIGNDRYETSAALVRAFASSNNVVAATGENFPDALSAGALVAKRKGALLLVPPSGLSAQSRVLGRELNVTSITVVGGGNSLSDNQVKKHLR